MANIKVSELNTASSFGDSDYLMLVQNNENKKISGTNFKASILESGSNANGNYIKFSDGTMICYGRQSFTGAVNISYGSVYRGDTGTINLPATFINTNFTKYVIPIAPINSIYVVDEDITTSLFKYFPIAYISRESDNRSVEFIAIGKWK